MEGRADIELPWLAEDGVKVPRLPFHGIDRMPGSIRKPVWLVLVYGAPSPDGGRYVYRMTYSTQYRPMRTTWSGFLRNRRPDGGFILAWAYSSDVPSGMRGRQVTFINYSDEKKRDKKTEKKDTPLACDGD